MVCKRVCEKCKVDSEEAGRAIGRYRFVKSDGTEWWLCTDCAKAVAAARRSKQTKEKATSSAQTASEFEVFMTTHWECQGLRGELTQAIHRKYRRRLEAIGASQCEALDATMELEPANYNTPAISLKGLVAVLLARREKVTQQAEDEPLDQRQRNWSCRCMTAIGTALNTKRHEDIVTMYETCIQYSESDLEHGVGDPEQIRQGIAASKREIEALQGARLATKGGA